jgi:hypothetical protein
MYGTYIATLLGLAQSEWITISYRSKQGIICFESENNRPESTCAWGVQTGQKLLWPPKHYSLESACPSTHWSYQNEMCNTPHLTNLRLWWRNPHGKKNPFQASSNFILSFTIDMQELPFRFYRQATKVKMIFNSSPHHNYSRKKLYRGSFRMYFWWATQLTLVLFTPCGLYGCTYE